MLGFLLWHLRDFALELGPEEYYKNAEGEVMEPYDKAISILTHSSTLIVYLIGTVALCAHLLHGFSSAFRSLGISHPKYNRFIRNFGYFFAVVFGLGFATFPLWASFLHSEGPVPLWTSRNRIFPSRSPGIETFAGSFHLRINTHVTGHRIGFSVGWQRARRGHSREMDQPQKRTEARLAQQQAEVRRHRRGQRIGGGFRGGVAGGAGL